MRPFSALLPSILLLGVVHAQNKPEPIRLCVSMLKNQSLHSVNPKWQRTQLIRAFERINKGKDVSKGKAARIDTVALDSTDEADPKVRESKCEFVVHTELTEVQRTDVGQISVPTPSAIEFGRVNVGDPRASPRESNDATVTYRVLRNGDPESWSSGIVTGKESMQDEALVSELMDQVAKRVASEVRQNRSSGPQ
jgi:hypothetical protein